MEKNEIIRMRGITKKFGPVTVLDNVDFSVHKGEVLALVGANGAGKSTLMKILNGIYTPTSGEIFLNGTKVAFKNPIDAYLGGVSMIHQGLDLLDNLSVAENIFLGREIMNGVRVDRAAMYEETRKLMESLHFDIDATAEVGTLTTAKKQMILVARTVSLHSNLIVMDEPTSALSFGETQALFQIVQMLKRKGISIIYISHYLEEIFAVSDRVAVLRNGRLVNTANTAECTEQQLVEWMIGHAVERHKMEQHDFSDAPEVLRLEALTQGNDYVHDVDLTLREGEIIGLAGVVGAGRTELLRMIYGAEACKSGKIFVSGKETTITSPTVAVSYKMGFVPEDRKMGVC